MTEAVNILLILFIFATAVAAVYASDLVSAVFLLGAYSFFLSILWTALDAVDVSFTEAVVGVGASTIFLILGLFQTKHWVVARKASGRHYQAAFAVLALGVLLLWGSQDLPIFGDVLSAPNQHVSPFYLQNALQDSHTPNAVTAVVVDYRGFDTLIETTVIFTAGVACLLIARGKA